MAETSASDAKLTQYLAEAYAKEKELERSLQAHIAMTDRKPYKKKLQEHLKETKSHARQVERRIKKLGAAGTVANLLKEGAALTKQAAALGKGQLHAARGTGDEEKLLKNAKTEYSEEHEEIATYTAIETLAEEVGDKETAKLARQIRREEERMARFLERQIPVLTKAVARAEIPSSERNGGRRSSSRPSRRSSSRRSSSARGASKRSGSGSRSGSKRRSTSKRSSRSGGSSRRRSASS